MGMKKKKKGGGMGDEEAKEMEGWKMKRLSL
jgi:hypothetical protein